MYARDEGSSPSPSSTIMKTKLSFEDWREANVDDLDCRFAETGADREPDFDRERAEEELYEDYLREE